MPPDEAPAALNCHLPIRVRVLGTPDEDALELLSRQVAAQVRSRLSAARRELPQAPAGEREREAHERYDPARDAPAGYDLPSFGEGGRATSVPVRSPRPWIVLRAVNFQTTVGAFLDALVRIRDEPLPSRVLYDEQADQERWVELWWVQVNLTTSLTDLEAVLAARAKELARVGSRQVLADLISPHDGAWQELTHLDGSGAVRAQIPSPGARNQRRLQGSGQDAVVSHGGWVLFAFMVLPGVSVEEVLDVGTLTPLRIPLPDAGFLVDQRRFGHQYSVDWDRFAEEFADDQVTVWLLAPTCAGGCWRRRRTTSSASRPSSGARPVPPPAARTR